MTLPIMWTRKLSMGFIHRKLIEIDSLMWELWTESWKIENDKNCFLVDF